MADGIQRHGQPSQGQVGVMSIARVRQVNAEIGKAIDALAELAANRLRIGVLVASIVSGPLRSRRIVTFDAPAG